MLLHIVLASEILSSLICMHCLHGKKIKLEKGTVLIVILLFFILEAINLFQWNYLTTIIYTDHDFGTILFWNCGKCGFLSK